MAFTTKRKGKQTSDPKSHVQGKGLDEPAIFKLQRSQMSSDNLVRQLAYNEKRTIQGEVVIHPAGEDWRLHDTYGEKFYVRAQYNNETGKLHFKEADILKRSQWPSW